MDGKRGISIAFIVFLCVNLSLSALMISTRVQGAWPFSKGVQITNNVNSGAYFPEMAVDSVGNIYVVWVQTGHDSGDIYLAKSTDGGRTFGPKVRVDDTGNSSNWQIFPDIFEILH